MALESQTDPLRVFVASSSKQIKVAKTIASLLNKASTGPAALQPPLHAYAWTEATFSFSSTYIESLEYELECADFAVVIMTAQDVALVGREIVDLPRDNVIFELGLFMGRLGRDRCYFFVDDTSATHLPSDLTGVKAIRFVPDDTASAEARARRLSARCRDLVAQIRKSDLGARYKPSRDTRTRQHEAWRFSQKVAGCWWSFRQFDPERIAVVTLIPDEAVPTVHVRGEVFAPEAPNRSTASWASLASILSRHDHEWTLRFIWKGSHYRPKKKYQGASEYVFPATASRLLEGRGFLLETTGKRSKEKDITLRRWTASDEQTMCCGDDYAKSALLCELVNSWKGTA